MAGYKELVDEYRMQETTSGVTAMRAFYPLTGGGESLPDIGDAFKNPVSGTTFNNCLCITRDREAFFPDPDNRANWSEKIVCNFGTGSVSSDRLATDEEERRFQLGGEIITIDDPINWTWNLQGDPLDQPAFLSNVMGSFTRQRQLGSDAAKETWVTNRLEVYAGCINTAKFEGFREGSVLFQGVSGGGTQYDSQGSKFWLFELSFAFRIIRAAGGEDYAGDLITKDDWLYLWNKDAGGAGQGAWDQPKSGDGKFLYEKKDLTQIFS